MKKIIIGCLAVLWLATGYAQTNAAMSQSDFGRIILAAYVPTQVENIPEGAKNMLLNKLNQLITAGGMGGSAYNQRFIITANTVVVTKDITSTAPVMTALSLDVTFYIGDGIDGNKFASSTVSIKGVGTNETKAYISAIKNINAESPSLQAFLKTGKEKIVQYYKTRCDFIMKEAQAQANQGNYDRALYIVTSVPEVCKECYVKSVDAIPALYKKQINKDCQVKLAQAKAAWAANQSYDGANAAGDIISQIDPASSCFGEVKTFINQIGKGVKDENNKVWKYTFKDQENQVDVIKAARDVAIAYATHQPDTSYSYSVTSWW
ncbi:hypothetical protein ACFFGT_30905 [Mucilaginibacter angelicae]|uniref:Uncharacterized protein n=1 Tax=Mucilaginibacter angelicae TaxID=869718 RepID=A0ABV6LGQ5_9SPHI